MSRRKALYRSIESDAELLHSLWRIEGKTFNRERTSLGDNSSFTSLETRDAQRVWNLRILASEAIERISLPNARNADLVRDRETADGRNHYVIAGCGCHGHGVLDVAVLTGIGRELWRANPKSTATPKTV